MQDRRHEASARLEYGLSFHGEVFVLEGLAHGDLMANVRRVSCSARQSKAWQPSIRSTTSFRLNKPQTNALQSAYRVADEHGVGAHHVLGIEGALDDGHGLFAQQFATHDAVQQAGG